MADGNESSNAFTGAIIAAVAGAFATGLRFLNGREAAKDRAHAEHIASLKAQNAEKQVELVAVRADMSLLIREAADKGGQLKKTLERDVELHDENQVLRAQNAALQGDLTLTRDELKTTKVQIEEQITAIDYREKLLDTHNIPWRN